MGGGGSLFEFVIKFSLKSNLHDIFFNLNPFEINQRMCENTLGSQS